MGVLEALAIGFSEATSLQVLPYLVGGALFGLFLGVIPGLSGHFAMAMVIPFLYSLSPGAGIAFLLGSHSTVAQGGGLTAIFFSTPGCGQNAATVLDGPPMRDKGLAGMAAGAAITSCFLGAAFGVMVLAMSLPVLQQVVQLFGPAEICMLVLLALTFVAVLGKEDLSRSFIAGLAGLLLAMVGLENATNQARFTFGLLSLRDGLPLVPVILGLFAAAEMAELWAKGGSMSGRQKQPLSARETQRQIFQGAYAAMRRWWLVLRCSTIGTVMGLIPGLGSASAAFVAYGHARQTSSSPETFGKGNIEGVIGPESANDAVEGGALASTIAFGIPGSSSMAIVLAGLFVLGLKTGPDMVTNHTDLVFVMIFTVLLGNLVGTVTGMFLVNPLSRISSLSPMLLVPVLLPIIFTGAYAVHRSAFDIGIVFIFGVLGYLMKLLGYSRAALLIGFVLGAVLEQNLFLSVQLDGPVFFLQPVPLAFLAVALLILGYNLWTGRTANRPSNNGVSEYQSPRASVRNRTKSAAANGWIEKYFLLVLGFIFAAALVAIFAYRSIPARMPLIILVPLLTLTSLQCWRVRKTTRAGSTETGPGAGNPLTGAVGLMGWMLSLVTLILLTGHYVGTPVFIFVLLRNVARKSFIFSLSVAAAVVLALFGLFELALDIELYRGLVYRVLAGYRIF